MKRISFYLITFLIFIGYNGFSQMIPDSLRYENFLLNVSDDDSLFLYFSENVTSPGDNEDYQIEVDTDNDSNYDVTLDPATDYSVSGSGFLIKFNFTSNGQSKFSTMTNGNFKLAVLSPDSIKETTWSDTLVEFSGADAQEPDLIITDNGNITERLESDGQINIFMKDFEFKSTISISDFNMTGSPTGVNLATANSSGDHNATLTVTNASRDYDSDYVANITVKGSATEGTTGDLTENYTFEAINDQETLSFSGSITEGSENGAMIDVSLTGGTFIPSFDTSKWVISHLPTGVTKGSIVPGSDSVTAIITLSGNRTVDYDIDITNLELKLDPSQYHEADSIITVNTGVVFNADGSDENLNAEWKVNNGIESTLDSEEITVSIDEGTFYTANINTTNVQLSGTAVTEAGVSLNNISNVTLTSFDLALSWDGTDFDEDKILTITVNDNAYAEGTGNISDNLTVTAEVEPVTIEVTDDGLIEEAAEDGEALTVTINSDKFIENQVNTTNVIVSNLPKGVTKSIDYVDEVTIEIILAGNRTVDYDSDIETEIKVLDAAILGNTGDKIANYTFIATDDNETLSYSGTVSEEQEDGDSIDIVLSGGTYSSTFDPGDWTLSGLPAGVSYSLSKIDAVTVRAYFTGNRTVDYDSDKTLQVEINASQVDDTNDLMFFSDVVFIADNDDEALSFSGTVSEEQEDGDSIDIVLSGGTYSSTIDPGEWTLSGLPAGVLYSLSKIDAVTVRAYFTGNRTVDYDTDKILQVDVHHSQVDDRNDPLSASGTVFLAVDDDEELVISGTIEENAEDGDTITVTLINGTFVDPLVLAQWELINPPDGVQIGDITRASSMVAYLILSGNRLHDYDSDILNCGISVNESEVDDYDGPNLTVTTGVTFQALNDEEEITLTDATVTEASEDAHVITVNLSGGTFATSIDKTGWQLTNLPTGVSIDEVSRVNSLQATITLAGNRTVDYDVSKKSVLKIPAMHVNDRAGSLEASDTVIFFADNDPESLTMSNENVINEGAEDGETILVDLNGGTFVNPVTPDLWILENLPGGVTKGSVSLVNSQQVRVTFNGNRTVDYDTDITSVKLTVPAADVEDHSGTDFEITSGVTFTAYDDPEFIAIGYSSTPGTNGTEATLDNEVIDVMLNSGTIVPTEINTTNVYISGTAIEKGITLEEVSNVSGNTFEALLDYDGTDFDSDLELIVNLTGDAYHDGTEILRDTIIIPATFEDPSFTIFDPGDVTEGAQDGKYIELTVEEDTFNVATVSQDNIFLTDMPGGVSVDEVQFIKKNTVRIYFAGNSFPDYDTPVDATVHILTEALVQHNSTYTIPYVFSAVNDAESISAKFRHSVGTNGAEATIDDEIIVINISGGHFLSSMINETNVSVTGNYTTAGISVDNIESAGADSFYIYLDHNGQDYDVDKELSVTVDVAAFTDSDAPVSTNITLPATNDPEDINLSWNFSPGTNGKEATLNNEVLHVEITGGTFIPDNLTGANIFLEGQAPSVGVSLDETKIYNKSLKSFNVEINWDSTDFDTDKTLVLQLSGDAYHDGTALLADTVMLDALNDQEVMNVSWAPDPGTNGLEASLDNEALIIAIYGGTFNTSEISLSNITLSGSAVSEAGVSASRVRAGTVTKTRFELELDWDGTDFDNNKELIVSLAMDAFEDPDSALIGSIILPATKEKVTTSGSIIDGSNLEANIKLGGETIVLSLSGTSWLPADGTDLTHANDYKSSTINTLFDGFYHVDGWDDLKEIVDALKADVTGGDNDAVIREDDYTLRITLPPVPNFEIDDGAIFSIIVPATLLEGTNGDVEITDPLAIMETASTTATIYGSKDICVGDSAMLTLVLGGSSPWRVVYSKDGIVHGEISNITDNVHEFWVAEPGIYKIDTVQDLYFTVGRPNVKIYGTAIINQNPLPDNVLISGLAPAYGVTTDPVTITSNGSPSGGVFTGEGVFYVSNDYKFYPGVAGVGNDLPIIYKYTDVNGCSNSDTASVNVIEAEGNITFNGKEESHFCYYDSLILIEGVGTDEDSTGVFDIEGTSRGLVEIGDEVYINPRELYDEGTSQKTFLLTYNYNSNTADLEWSETFIIEYIEPVRIITGLQTGEERRFCQDEPPVNLEGSKSEGIFSGPGIVRDPVDGFIFDPSAAPIGESTIQFSYSTLNCYSDTSVNVDVFQVPKPFFNIESRCIDGEFDSTQFVNITSPDSLVGEWEWNFGDGDVENPLANTSSLKNPKHFYQTAGTKTVMLTSRNKPLFNSCEADFSKTITLGEKPNPNFTWETVCFNNERPVQFKNPGSNQDIYKWHFPNLSGKDSVLTTKEPAIIFPELKEYSIKLVQTTNQFNCVDSVTKTIRFRPMYDVAVADYFENFEGDIIEWSQENEANSRNSWTLGKPDLSGLNGAASGDKAWYTLINRDEPENSWVSGPCFNFENAEKPMVSLDIWRSLSYNRDGAVLQYISNENADWTNVGAEEGINWFNSFQIIGNPGDQRNGWTSLTPVFSPDEDWVNASRWLDELKGKTDVIFRIAYGYGGFSTDPNEGFAFDNIQIGERAKVVILEHFTNAYATSALEADNIINQIVKNQHRDVIDLQYHTGFPSGDPIYEVNPTDPTARLLYYAKSGAPYSFIDGRYEFDHSASVPNEKDIFLRALLQPDFDILLQTEKSDESLSVTVNLIALDSIPQTRLSLHVVVVEEEVFAEIDGTVKKYISVVRKMLPDAAGTSFEKAWKRGSKETVDLSWTYNNINDPQKVRIVAFVQDEATREIYQATADKSYMFSVSTPKLIADEVGVETIGVNPNPASDKIYLDFEKVKSPSSELYILDITGKPIMNKNIIHNNGIVFLDVSQIMNGIYFISVYDEKRLIDQKKLIIND